MASIVNEWLRRKKNTKTKQNHFLFRFSIESIKQSECMDMRSIEGEKSVVTSFSRRKKNAMNLY